MRHGYTIGIVLFIIALMTVGFMLFANCYSDHRDELGLGFWTSVAACSG